MKNIFTLTALVGLAAVANAEPIKTLLITGKNNHNWRYTSRVHKDTLEATGKFSVDITDEPEKVLDDAKALSKYQLLVLDYNDPDHRWDKTAEANFEKVVESGTGVVAIHSANNAFKGWSQYEKMLGYMWREGAGHGQFHEFEVVTVDTSDPIVAGIASFKTSDELYHKLSKPQPVNIHLLAQAMSTKESGGTGANEPMIFTTNYVKGRVFATPLGHVWEGSDSQKVSISNPMFKVIICRGAEWAATGKVTPSQYVEWKDVRTHNTLTSQETEQGWQLLFDGKAAKFHTFGGKGFPAAGWKIEDGELRLTKGGGVGDLATDEEYKDFEFACDWKVAPGGNSGIIYRATEDHKYPWETGPEMQILDDLVHADGKKPKTRAGTLYDLVPCAFDVCRPAGEWNHARAVVKGTHIQHFLNDFKVVDIDINSDDYKKAHAASKWPGMKDFNTKSAGHICLQDHGDEVAFRNIRIRALKAN